MFTLLILLTSIVAIHGTHFDGGSISYKVIGTNGSKLIVRITQTYTYVYPTIYCNNTYIANQWNLVFGSFNDATATLTCIANCTTKGGYTAIPVASKCTDFSAGMQITVGQRTDDVLINNGSYFVAAYQESAFRNLDLPNGGGSTLGWSISTLIDLRMRPDGTYNTPPKASMISPIYIPVGVKQTISIPTIDEDNDNVRCRFANGSNECGQVCPPGSLPTGTTISSNCTLTITGTTAGDWYAVALQVEDFGNSTSTKPYSSVPVQFLIHVYDPPACTQRPYLYGPYPDGTCVSVQVGVPYKLILYTENYCTSYNVTIVDIATQSFPIVIKTPIVRNNQTTWSVNLTWTPTADQVGSQVFCSVGIDSASVQTNQYCLTFSVGNGSLGVCPGTEIPTTELITTAALTTVMPTTEAPTTVIPTTEALTTAIPTTEAPTTVPTTTTTTVENTTIANTTSPNIVVIVVPIVIFIPIVCCCCCWLFCLIRPCRAVDVEREKKPVITYTIEGAYVNKDASLIGLRYEINENDPNNTGPLTDSSYITWNDTSLAVEPLPSKFPGSKDNNDNVSLSLTHTDVPISFDRTSYNSDKYKTMMDPTTTTNYEQYPLSPSQFLTRSNRSNAPATVTSTMFGDIHQLSTDSFDFTSLSQATISSNSHHRPTARPWTKHPRWVLRLSQPKHIHPTPLNSSRRSSGQEAETNTISSGRSTKTIPRYVFVED